MIAVSGTLTGSFNPPIFGLGGPEMWFFGTIIVLLAVGGALVKKRHWR